MKRCMYCGYENEDRARMCAMCGNRLVEVEERKPTWQFPPTENLSGLEHQKPDTDARDSSGIAGQQDPVIQNMSETIEPVQKMEEETGGQPQSSTETAMNAVRSDAPEEPETIPNVFEQTGSSAEEEIGAVREMAGQAGEDLRNVFDPEENRTEMTETPLFEVEEAEQSAAVPSAEEYPQQSISPLQDGTAAEAVIPSVTEAVQSGEQGVQEAAPQQSAQWVQEAAPQQSAQWVQEAAPRQMAQGVQEAAPQQMVQGVQEMAPQQIVQEAAPQQMAQGVQEAAVQQMVQGVQEAAPQQMVQGAVPQQMVQGVQEAAVQQFGQPAPEEFSRPFEQPGQTVPQQYEGQGYGYAPGEDPTQLGADQAFGVTDEALMQERTATIRTKARKRVKSFLFFLSTLLYTVSTVAGIVYGVTGNARTNLSTLANTLTLRFGNNYFTNLMNTGVDWVMKQETWYVNGAYLVLFIPAVFVMIGLWTAFFQTSAKKDRIGTSGYTLVFVIELLKCIVICITLIGALALSIVYVVAAGAAAETMSLIVGVVLLLTTILMTVFIIMFFVQLIYSIRVIRNNVRTGEDWRPIPGYLILVSLFLCAAHVLLLLLMASDDYIGLVHMGAAAGWLLLFSLWAVIYRIIVRVRN